MFNELDFQFKYRSDHDSLFEDFYFPCLENSIRYDRAAGYFTSNSLKLLARGLQVFLENNGKIRIVANPKLTTEDIRAIELGYIAREEVIESALLKELENSIKNIEDDTLNILSWLIYKGQLEIKIAYVETGALYHEKFGIFYDEQGDAVAFSGSSNETYSGLSTNFEKIDVYTEKREIFRVKDTIKDFEKLWNNQTDKLHVIDLPESIESKLMDSKSKVPPTTKVKNNQIKLRPYQSEAIESWINSNHQGIFEMATGTGKTITSLMAAKKILEQNKRLFTVIIVPFTHLVEQWGNDIKKILGNHIIKCFDSKGKWDTEALEAIQEFNIGISNNCTVITTYSTASSKCFKKMFSSLRGETMIIADECHKITLKGFNDYPFDIFEFKLGLSATPDRWFDEEGTNFIKNKLGNTVFSYDLETAIKNKMLTEYRYYPQVIHLSDEEMELYKKYTNQIVKLYHSDEERTQKILERLLIKRAEIISKASEKIPRFLKDISNENLKEIAHTLVYCGPGQIDILTKELNSLGLKVSKFNSDIKTKDREKILRMFENTEIQVLVAIKCLDEGVDVPSTRKAFFLSSTSNPREFVQRRGRILRKFEGKQFSEIHDYVTLPFECDYEEFKSIASKELPRFAEFSSAAINSSEAKNSIYNYLVNYGLEELMYKKPWDIYKEEMK